MCAAAEWRFSTKCQLHDWARQERDNRWIMALTFMDCDKMANETKYYKNQSILCRMAAIHDTYKDITLMINNENCAVHQNKMDRVLTFIEETTNIGKWGEEARQKAWQHVEEVTGKQGRKEEETRQVWR